MLCSERFDRPPQGQKLHQEDFCQVLGVDPERKYEQDGGPGLKKCAAVIRQYSALPADDLARFVRWVGFNYLIGNEDAHAKNLALLYLPDGLRLTPHYDLVSTEVYADLEQRLAMKVGRAWDIRDVKRSDWSRVADIVDVPWDQLRMTLLEQTALVRAALPKTLAASRERFGHATIYDQIADLIRRHCTQLECALGAH